MQLLLLEYGSKHPTGHYVVGAKCLHRYAYLTTFQKLVPVVVFFICVCVGVFQVLGAASMVTNSGKHPGQLKDDVTSPGGTTISGIHELEKGGFRGTLMNAVVAAAKRSRELS